MPSTLGHACVTAAELVRQFGRWQDRAASEPVIVTHHGRGRIVMLSTQRYQQLIAAEADGAGAAGAQARGPEAEALMDHVAQGFVAFGKDMTVGAINRAACCFLKVRRDAVLGRRLGETLPGIEETVGYATLARAAAGGTVTTLEMPSFAYEGRWLLFHIFPYRDGAACLFNDITDELEARRAVDLRAATLGALASHGAVGRARLSIRGLLGEVDATFVALAGFPRDGLLRTRLVDIVTPACRELVAEAVEAVLEGQTRGALDVRLLTGCGTERAARLGLAPLRLGGGTSGAVAILTPALAEAAVPVAAAGALAA